MAVRTGEIHAAQLQALITSRPALLQAVKGLGSFLLGFLLGAARLFGACGPFGIAAAGAMGTELNGLLGLFGALCGYLLSGGLVASVRYIAAMLLVYTSALVFRSMEMSRSRLFLPANALLFTALTGLLYRADADMSVPWLLRYVTECLLAAACSGAFSLALHPAPAAGEESERQRRLCLAVLGACVLMSLTGIGLRRVVYLGPLLALLTVMLASYGGGALLGCAVGACFGLAMDAAAAPELFRASAYALGGLAAGVLARRGRLAFALAFCSANAFSVLLCWNMEPQIAALYECFTAVVIFMLLPGSVVSAARALLQADDGRGETAFRRYQAARLERVAAAFVRLHEVVQATATPEGTGLEMEAVFDRSAEGLCHDCENKDLCWQAEYQQTLDALRRTEEPMMERGSLRQSDLPESFRERCQRSEAFVLAVNSELRGMLYRRQYRARLKEAKTAAYGQFFDLARIMHTASRELGGSAGPDPQAERRLDRFMKSVGLEGSCSVFRDGRGRMRVLMESPGAAAFAQDPEYLNKLSAVLGVRLCRLGEEEKDRLVFIQAEPLAASVGIAAMKKDGESISGDRSCYFKTDAGLLCVILSDGMGCGARAAVESSAAVKILEELLRAGVEPETAMRLLNSVVLLKNGEDWSYATVDLCCVDLFTGQTSFYKYGAAPSYIKTGRAIRRVKGRSLAAGMAAGDGSAPDVVKMRLRPGHVALIASDGVMAEDSDRWLREILENSEGKEMKLLARQTLQAALQRFGNGDDMTAMAIRLEERP